MKETKSKFLAILVMLITAFSSLTVSANIQDYPLLVAREKLSEEIVFIEGESVRFRTFAYEDGSVVVFAALVEETFLGFAAANQNLYETDIFSETFVDAVNAHADMLLSMNIKECTVKKEFQEIQPRNPFVVTSSGTHRRSGTSHRYPNMHIQHEFDWFLSSGPFAIEAIISNGILRAWNHTTGVLGMQFDQSITRFGLSISFTFGWPSFSQSGTTHHFRYQNNTEQGFAMVRFFPGNLRGTWAEITVFDPSLFSISSMATQAVPVVPGQTVVVVSVTTTTELGRFGIR